MIRGAKIQIIMMKANKDNISIGFYLLVTQKDY